MKLIKKLIVIAAAIFLTSKFIPALSFANDYRVLLIAVIFMFLADLLIKPLFKILLLPVNLITLGSFRWLASALVLYLVVYIVKDFTISNYFFPGYLGLPTHQFGPILSVIIISFVYSFIHSLIRKILN